MKTRSKFNPVHVILLRLAAYPILFALRCLICLVLLAAWGKWEAKNVWQELA